MMKIDKLPDAIDPTLNLERIRVECLALVKKRAYVSAGAAVVPVPFLDVVIDIVVEAGKVIRGPGVTISSNMAANFYSVGCSYYHRCCQQQHHRCKCNCSQFLHLLTSYFPIQSIQQHTV